MSIELTQDTGMLALLTALVLLNMRKTSNLCKDFKDHLIDRAKKDAVNDS